MKEVLQKLDLLDKNVILRKSIGKLEITCAGMPKQCYDYVTFENFRTGLTVPGKLTFSHVKRWGYFKRNRVYYKREKSKKGN